MLCVSHELIEYAKYSTMGRAARKSGVSVSPPNGYLWANELRRLLTMSDITSILIIFFCRAAVDGGDTVVGAAILTKNRGSAGCPPNPLIIYIPKLLLLAWI